MALKFLVKALKLAVSSRLLLPGTGEYWAEERRKIN
jgi:hypothetical protein